jgi:hypothetical protein
MTIGSDRPGSAAALTVGAVALALVTLAGRRRASHLRSIATRAVRAAGRHRRDPALTTATVVLFGLAAAAFVAAH